LLVLPDDNIIHGSAARRRRLGFRPGPLTEVSRRGRAALPWVFAQDLRAGFKEDKDEVE